MAKQPIQHYLKAILAYFVIGLIITYPLVLHLTTQAYGLPGDGYGTLWSFWWNMTHGIQWTAPAQPTLLAAAKILTLAFSETTTYNLLLLFGYPLAGIAIYLIVYNFTQDKAASFLAGFIYILGPYHIYQSYVHLSLAMIAWLPLYLYALLLWLKDPQSWRAAVSGSLLAIVILDNYYYGYLAILVTVFFVVGLLIQCYRGKLSFWTALYQGVIALGVSLIITSPFIVPSLFSGVTTSYERPIRELFVFRAEWWDFFVPAITHPVIGSIIRQTTSYALSGSNYFERTLYLGYMPLILAILGAWRTKKSWLTYFLLTLFLASIVMATAPDFLAPALHKFFPTFRVYSRFGLLSLMVTAILAGIGIASLSKGVRSWMLYLAIGLFIVVDFYPLYPSPMMQVNATRPAETLLAQQPTGKTIVYPYASGDEVRTSEYLSDSRRFNQPLFNAVDPISQNETIREAMLDPNSPKALTLMKNLGIRYVLIRKDIYYEGRLPKVLLPFYDPDYPKYLPAWNGGVPPDITDPRATQLYSNDQESLYRID